MLKSNLDLRLNNTYHVELIEAATGKVKQSGDFHNIHTKNLWNIILGMHYSLGGAISVGSGTRTPSFDDTGVEKLLFTNLYNNSAEWGPSNPPIVKSVTWIDDYTLQKVVSFNFAATSAYVGNVTEISLGSMYYNNGREWHAPSGMTRALLTDSEGQVITFKKTDLDVLVITVTIEASIESTNSNFIMLPKCDLLKKIIHAGGPSGTDGPRSKLGRLSLIRFKNDLTKAVSFLEDMTPSTSTSGVTEASTRNGHAGTYTYASMRLPATEVTSQTYYTAVSIPSLGYFILPNEEIFPTYTIENISIGTGDGSTKDFINPLNYFKKDTEKVYKNGTLLTRDVDYTINHMGNKDCKPEVAQMYPIKAAHADIDIAAYMGQYDLKVYSLVWPSAISSSLKASDMMTHASAFSNTAPLYIEYEEEVTMNCFKSSGGLKGLDSGGGTSNITNGTLFYLDYSTDGETYAEIGSVATTAAGAAFVLDFPEVTAKYWRVRTNYSKQVIGVCAAGHYLTLQRKDPYISFVQAPVEGDILTMDVDMDIIMKNSNFVVDLNCTINFTI